MKKEEKSLLQKNPLLEIKNLSAWYGPLQILHTVEMHVNRGEIVSIIGPNGAGKSTTLKSIVGFVEKKEGTILFHGENITKIATDALVSKGLCYVPQGRSIFPSLTVLENIEIGAYTRTDQKEIKKDSENVLEFFPQLEKQLKTRAGLLSGGEQQLVSLARALMMHPELMLLDEPSLGLSPQMKRLIFEKIVEINKTKGVTMLIVEQNAKLTLELSDRAYVLELGKNRLEGTGKDLLHDKRVQHLYLGGEF